MVSLLLLLACGQQGVETTAQPTASAEETPPTETPVQTPTEDEAAPEMDAVNLLIRASLDLRGVRPSVAEIASVEADPAALDLLIDSFLTDDRFGSRVRAMWAPTYLTRLDYFTVSGSAYGIADTVGFAASVGDEPLRVLSRIAEEDLPYTDIVTGDWTMADELLAEAWKLDYPEDATGWQVSYYTDGRPAAGVLTTNGMWWRYLTTYSNGNRGRANAISKVLLCTDYLTKPIAFDRNVNLLEIGRASCRERV